MDKTNPRKEFEKKTRKKYGLMEVLFRTSAQAYIEWLENRLKKTIKKRTMNELEDALSQWLLKHEDLNKAFMRRGEKTYTYQDVLDDLEENGEVSMGMIIRMCKLAVELFDKDKI
jgi:hypothetical protein